MNSAGQGGEPHGVGFPALRRLVAVPIPQFAEAHWGIAPLLSPGQHLPGGFDDLFSLNAADELIARRGLRTPFLRVAKQGRTLPERGFTLGGGVGAGIPDQVSDDRLLALFADGSTIVLQGLHRTWGPLIDLAQALSEELGHPAQVNAYLTPPQNTGFSDHYDVHDVFVLQIAGEKRWRIRPPVLTHPLRDQEWGGRQREVEEAATAPPLLEVTLRPGDCLYLPRGYLHAATALGDVSAHLTIGVHTWTGHHLVGELTRRALTRAADEERVRRSLPLGVDVSHAEALRDDLAAARAAAHAAIDAIGDDEIAAAMAARARAGQRAAPIGPLAQLAAAARLADGSVSTLRLRPHLRAGIHPATGPDTGATLVSRAGRLRLDPRDLPAVEALLDAGEATTSALGADLARRLLLAGIVLPQR